MAQRHTLLLGTLTFLVLSITLSHHYDTRDAFGIGLRSIHRIRVGMYHVGLAHDSSHRSNISYEALALEDITKTMPFPNTTHHHDTIRHLRRNMDIMRHVLPSPIGCTMDRVEIQNIPIQWHVLGDGIDNSTDAKTIIYLHGGAYIAGNFLSHQGLMCWLSRATHMRVLGIEYGIGPEHPMPQLTHDIYQIYEWLLITMHVKPQDMIVMGDSAGGGASLLFVQHLINQGKTSVLPAGVVAFSPWLDLTLSGDSWRTLSSVDDTLGNHNMLQMAREIAVGAKGTRLPYHDPRVSALFGTYHLLPPVYISVGGDECLLDDSRRFVDSAREAHVDVHLSIVPYMEHAFTVGGLDFFPEARHDMDRIIAWIRKHVGKTCGNSHIC